MAGTSQKQRQIELAASFLAHPAAQASEWDKQKNFLLAKGLNEEEVDQAHRIYLTGKARTWPLKPLPAEEALAITFAAPARPQGFEKPDEPSRNRELEDDMPLSSWASTGTPAPPPSPRAQDGVKQTAAAAENDSSSDSDSSSSSTSSDSDDVPVAKLAAEPVPAPNSQIDSPQPKARTLAKRQEAKQPEAPEAVVPSSSSSSSSKPLIANGKAKPSNPEHKKTGPQACQVAVCYRSDKALWPREATACALTREQRTQLMRLALQFRKPLEDCLEDMEQVKKKMSEYRRDCPGKQELAAARAELEVEAESHRTKWSDAISKVTATWQLSPPATVPPAEGVRPQIVRGRRWYTACLPAPGVKRVLGPLRPTLDEASRDYMAMTEQRKDRSATNKSDKHVTAQAEADQVQECVSDASQSQAVVEITTRPAQARSAVSPPETTPHVRKRRRIILSDDDD